MWSEATKKPIAAYLILTFAFAWGAELLLIILERLALFSLSETARFIITNGIIGFGAGLAPMYATVILLKKSGQIRGFKEFFRRIFKSDNKRKTILFTAVSCGILLVLNIIFDDWSVYPWYMVIALLPLTVFGGGLEEIGWRGFLGPALEEKLPFIPATMLVGIIWAVWHYPLWMVEGAGQSQLNMIAFTCSTIAFAFLLAALYKLTQSVFACILIHAWSNALPLDISNSISMELFLFCAVEICLSIIVIYIVSKQKRQKINKRALL